MAAAGWKCEFCPKQFIEENALRNHVASMKRNGDAKHTGYADEKQTGNGDTKRMKPAASGDANRPATNFRKMYEDKKNARLTAVVDMDATDNIDRSEKNDRPQRTSIEHTGANRRKVTIITKVKRRSTESAENRKSLLMKLPKSLIADMVILAEEKAHVERRKRKATERLLPQNKVIEEVEVFLQGLPADTTDKPLRNHCEQFGRVRVLTIPYTDEGDIKGYAFVTYYNPLSAQRCVNGHHDFHNKLLKCSFKRYKSKGAGKK